MTYFPNLNDNLSYLEGLADADRRELLEMFANSQDPGEVFAADVWACREFIAAAKGKPERIEAALRDAGMVGPRWDAVLGEDTYVGAVVAAALERWPASAPMAAVEMMDPVNGAQVCSRRASAVAKRSIEWLWHWRLAFGHVAVLDGDPGLDKSTIACDIIARFTRGLPMPGEEPPVAEEPKKKRRSANCDAMTAEHQLNAELGVDASAPSTTIERPRGFAVIISAEDNESTGIVPRLVAAGADLNQVEIVDEVNVIAADGSTMTRQVLLPNDLPALEAVIRRTGARLLVIDPLMAFIGNDRRGRQIDSHKDQSIRQLMYELRRLAERLGICIIIIRHISKSASTSALRRGSGSIGIAGAARCVLLAAEHPEQSGACALAGVKSNLAPLPPTLAYRLMTGSQGALHIDWLEDCDFSADDLLRIRRSECKTPTRQREAQQFIEEILKDGPKPAEEIWKQAVERGITRGTLARASETVGINHVRVRGGKWLWELKIPPLGALPFGE